MRHSSVKTVKMPSAIMFELLLLASVQVGHGNGKVGGGRVPDKADTVSGCCRGSAVRAMRTRTRAMATRTTLTGMSSRNNHCEKLRSLFVFN